MILVVVILVVVILVVMVLVMMIFIHVSNRTLTVQVVETGSEINVEAIRPLSTEEVTYSHFA